MRPKQTVATIVLLTTLFTPLTFCLADGLRKQVDSNGNVTWTNSGPSQSDKQQIETDIEAKKAESAGEIITKRHPEITVSNDLTKVFIDSRNYFISQGNSLESSMYLAESEMLRQGYISDEPPPQPQIVTPDPGVQAEQERTVALEREVSRLKEMNEEANRSIKHHKSFDGSGGGGSTGACMGNCGSDQGSCSPDVKETASASVTVPQTKEGACLDASRVKNWCSKRQSHINKYPIKIKWSNV